MRKSPTTEQIASIIVEEMMKWSLKDNENQRREQLYGMSDRLIRYFAFYDVLPTTLPGLPGGAAH